MDFWGSQFTKNNILTHMRGPSSFILMKKLFDKISETTKFQQEHFDFSEREISENSKS